MNKRSAMLVAAGLILALVAGAYALALGVTGPALSASAKTYPKVGAHAKAITVHRMAPSSAGVGAMSAPLHSNTAVASSYSPAHSYSGGYTSTGAPTHVPPIGSYYEDNGGGGGHDD